MLVPVETDPIGVRSAAFQIETKSDPLLTVRDRKAAIWRRVTVEEGRRSWASSRS